MKAPLRWLLAALFLCVHENVRAQDGGGIRGPATVVQGGTFDIDVASGDASVQVHDGTPGSTTSHPVPPGGRVTIPVPPVPPGTILRVTVGRGRRMSILLIEVTSP